jgi:hypothetical protein
MKRSSVAWMIISVTLPACTGPVRTPEPEPATALGELARLRTTGRLDEDRLECAPLAMIRVVDEMRLRLPELREARARGAASSMGTHAASVRDNQVQAEITQAAALDAVVARRGAANARANGNDRAALRQVARAGRLLDLARGDVLVTSSDDVVVPLLSDTEAERLAEYTRLMSERSGSAFTWDARVTERLREIEREQAGIQEVYASLFLQVYGDRELRCTRGRG